MLTRRTLGAAAFWEVFFLGVFFLDAFALEGLPAPERFRLLVELDTFRLCFFAGMFRRLREVVCNKA
jgi:hypothetical protein